MQSSEGGNQLISILGAGGEHLGIKKL